MCRQLLRSRGATNVLDACEKKHHGIAISRQHLRGIALPHLEDITLHEMVVEHLRT